MRAISIWWGLSSVILVTALLIHVSPHRYQELEFLGLLFAVQVGLLVKMVRGSE